VISSSTAEEYAFEIDTGAVTGAAAPSLFTAALVDGLRTGAADLDRDGLVSVDDLYAYVYEQARTANPHQSPEKKWGDIRGDFFIARNPHPPPPAPEPLPAKLAEALESPYTAVRSGAVQELLTIVHGSSKGLALTALESLRALRDDDSRLVSAAAETALSGLTGFASDIPPDGQGQCLMGKEAAEARQGPPGTGCPQQA
jgi:hypothetical protein